MGLALGLLAVMAGLLAASETAAQAVREGLALCGGSVIPALFPFLVVSRLFVATGSAAALGRLRMVCKVSLVMKDPLLNSGWLYCTTTCAGVQSARR